MAKMFYTQAEAAAKLGKTPEELKAMVREGRLREFMDNGPVYRIEDINKLGGVSEASPSSDADAVDLELVDESSAGASKEDTVITSAGISVFDDEDLQIEADPMAQTSITQSVDDQVSLETTGSGSGLLDLTREADDTSLGAELLEEIYPSTPTAESAEVMPAQGGQMGYAGGGRMEEQPPVFGPQPTVVEASDAMAPAFGGMAFIGMIAVAFLAFVLTAIARDTWPPILNDLATGNNPMYLAVGLGAAAIVFWVIGPDYRTFDERPAGVSERGVGGRESGVGGEGRRDGEIKSRWRDSKSDSRRPSACRFAKVRRSVSQLPIPKHERPITNRR